MAATRTHSLISSPLGRLTVVAEADLLCGLYFEDHRNAPPVSDIGRRVSLPFGHIAEQLEAYFEGELTSFSVPLRLAGTQFQRRVWAGLRDIPYGQTITYGDLAGRLGQPTASRAVGLANARNPISIIVPCHRVIGRNGSLTGYGGGLERKRSLLQLETRTRVDLTAR